MSEPLSFDRDPESGYVRHRGGRSSFKVLSCGSMLGSAILYPLAHTGGFELKYGDLAIFVLSSIVFHALSLDSFTRVGGYSLSVALLVLLVTIASAGPSRKDLIPWLPLYVVFTSVTTIVVQGMVSWAQAPVTLPSGPGSWVADPGSERSGRPTSDGQARSPSESNRRNSMLFRFLEGPSSHYSGETNSVSSRVTLQGVQGEARSHWSPTTHAFVMENATDQGEDDLAFPIRLLGQLATEAEGDGPSPSSPRSSEETIHGPDVPLLHREL